jgi:hypothetical protein
VTGCTKLAVKGGDGVRVKASVDRPAGGGSLLKSVDGSGQPFEQGLLAGTRVFDVQLPVAAKDRRHLGEYRGYGRGDSRSVGQWVVTST